MNDELLQELISAYVDGEVSADERKRAEQLLTSDASLRQYHDELLQLRRGLQGLPRYRLPEDFAASVLRQAERTMLSAPREADAAAPTKPAAQARAGILLAVLALAATLVVAVSIYFSGRGGSEDLRMAETAAPKAEQDAVAGGPRGTAADRPLTEEVPSPQLAQADVPPRSAASSEQALSDQNPPATAGETAPTLEPSELAAAEAAGMPADVAAAASALPVYTLVVEVVLSQRGMEQKVFETALERAQIPWKNRISVDRRLESAMLTNRMFGGVTADQLPEAVAAADSAPEGEKFDLVFVVAHGQQIVDLMTELEDRRITGEVTALMYDVAMGTSESDLAVQMNQLVLSSEPGDPDLVRAHPLSLEDDVRSRLLAALHAGDSKQRAEQREGEEALADNRNPNALPDAPGTGEATPQRAMLDVMEQMQFPVLYLLRSEAEVRRGTNGSPQNP